MSEEHTAGERDPNRPFEAVQNAAVEHALTVGESRDALALVGALETGPRATLRPRFGTRSAWGRLRPR
ncbi:hypothetical protein [Halobaculum roseum]|uniref:Acyl-CoA carboxylase subunit epsilon n=1 Tax=Halobaculum roseum TaxID=2175149 RepID=A0ABD5MNA1_9EURY|nr:hypothetical protein [Halobaculum roseum]QZY03008.1 hypothetical protein K6T36_02115 [Halobaculum roseum]